MLNINQTFKVLSSVVVMAVAAPAFAESAPVFDADALQMQAENDQPDRFPPAPQGQGEGFVQANNSQMEIDPQPIRLSMDQRLQRLEQQLNNIQNSDAAPKVDSLQDQMQVLRNQIEEMSHQLDQMQNQQRAVLSEVSRRVSEQGMQKPVTVASARTDAINANAVDYTVTNTATRLVRNPTPSNAAPASAPAAVQASKTDAPIPVVAPPSDAQNVETAAANQPNVAEEQQIYQTAYNLIKAKKYNDAVKALQSMLDKYPSGQFASNAHYWLGELYGLMGKNDLALKEFSNVVQTYPDSPRVSDAQLKIGLLLAAEFKWGDAKSALREVINRYPGTASSRLAAEQIKQIKQAGH